MRAPLKAYSHLIDGLGREEGGKEGRIGEGSEGGSGRGAKKNCALKKGQFRD